MRWGIPRVLFTLRAAPDARNDNRTDAVLQEAAGKIDFVGGVQELAHMCMARRNHCQGVGPVILSR